MLEPILEGCGNRFASLLLRISCSNHYQVHRVFKRSISYAASINTWLSRKSIGQEWGKSEIFRRKTASTNFARVAKPLEFPGFRLVNGIKTSRGISNICVIMAVTVIRCRHLHCSAFTDLWRCRALNFTQNELSPIWVNYSLSHLWCPVLSQTRSNDAQWPHQSCQAHMLVPLRRPWCRTILQRWLARATHTFVEQKRRHPGEIFFQQGGS